MNPITPQTPTPAAALDAPAPEPAIGIPRCYGVCCRLHSTCALYVSVEGSDPRLPAIEHCGPEFALYQPSRSGAA